MRSRWLTLALALGLGGCFDTHGVAVDGGPDTGVVCELRPASVMELECPLLATAAEPVVVVVTSSPNACCASGDVLPSVRTSGQLHEVTLEWDACDCCDTCRCIGPIASTEIDLGLLAPGRHTVEAGGQSCFIDVIAPPTPVECHPPAGPTDFRAPAHLFEDQAYPTTLTSDSSGSCSCSPRVVGADTLSYSLALCGCCDECECIDPGYQASDVRDPLPRGTHLVTTPHGASQVTVHARSECRLVDATAISIVPPRRDLLIGGPALTWARVDGEEWLCCATPQTVVEQVDTTGSGIALQLYSCVTDDCDCVPATPTPTSAWLALGELAPGTTYSARAGDVVATFTAE